MDKPPCSPSHTCLGEPPVGCNDTTSGLVDTKVQGKTGKKKKQKKRQSATSQMKPVSECSQVTAEEQSSLERPENRSAGSKHKKNTRKTRNQSISPESSSHQDKTQSAQQTSDRFTCDQSTQTEASQLQSVQTQSTQTPPIQDIHTQSTECKSTQTKQSSFSMQQAYWGRSFTEQSADEQKTQSSHLTLLSWNIDGLDPDNVFERAKGLLSHLGKYRADVVLLQELVPVSWEILKNIMKDYQFLQGMSMIAYNI